MFAKISPSEDDYCVVFQRHIGNDIIVVDQELEDIRPRRNAGRRTVRMRQLQRKVFGRQYERIAQHQMGGLQIAVFAKERSHDLWTDLLFWKLPVEWVTL
jgi:hypothetical protein